MGVSVSLIAAAVGGIIRFAVLPSSHVAGTLVNWNIAADGLLTAGAAGVLASVWMEAAARRRSAAAAPARSRD
jgi:hypothetical protein